MPLKRGSTSLTKRKLMKNTLRIFLIRFAKIHKSNTIPYWYGCGDTDLLLTALSYNDGQIQNYITCVEGKLAISSKFTNTFYL